MTYRLLQPEDYNILLESLEQDEYHANNNTMFFVEQGTITVVYEDDKGIVLFLRGKPDNDSLRLDIQFIDNNDGKRNLKMMLFEFPQLEERAKSSGFKNVWFESNVPLMRKFCVSRLGFKESGGNVLIKEL